MYGCPEAALFTGQLIDHLWRSPFEKVGVLQAHFEAVLTDLDRESTNE